jgi:hypothetical protein
VPDKGSQNYEPKADGPFTQKPFAANQVLLDKRDCAQQVPAIRFRLQKLKCSRRRSGVECYEIARSPIGWADTM